MVFPLLRDNRIRWFHSCDFIFLDKVCVVLETATGTTMFSSAKQNARGSQVLLWRGRQGRVGEEALAVHLTSHFFLFS